VDFIDFVKARLSPDFAHVAIDDAGQLEVSILQRVGWVERSDTHQLQMTALR
jgi:hypothetical protein